MTARPDSGSPVTIKVVGTFRSGTNLMRFLLEDKFDVRVVFNEVWWKHALAPTAFTGNGHYRPSFPIIVMAKQPASQNLSFYRFWKRKRPLLVTVDNYSSFIRSEFVVHDNSYQGMGPRYLFPTPTDYWNAFYFSYVSWTALGDLVTFVDFDELRHRTGDVLTRLRDKLGLRQKSPHLGTVPNREVLPGADGTTARFGDVVADESETVSDGDLEFIASRVNAHVYRHLFPLPTLRQLEPAIPPHSVTGI